jgi:hypothetical protein
MASNVNPARPANRVSPGKAAISALTPTVTKTAPHKTRTQNEASTRNYRRSLSTLCLR